MEKSIGTHWGVDARVVYTVVWFTLSKLQRPGIAESIFRVMLTVTSLTLGQIEELNIANQ